jgi:Na+/H+ antiporter NhaD/arsenite permease-like protein
MSTIAAAIFIITYTGIIFTRLPWINIDRPSAAFFGSVAMVLAGVLTFDEAIAAIDFNTIALLIGMMIIITVLEIDGFFSLIENRNIKRLPCERCSCPALYTGSNLNLPQLQHRSQTLPDS